MWAKGGGAALHEQIAQAFAKVDTGEDGTCEEGAVGAVIGSLGLTLTPEKLKRLLDQMHVDDQPTGPKVRSARIKLASFQRVMLPVLRGKSESWGELSGQLTRVSSVFAVGDMVEADGKYLEGWGDSCLATVLAVHSGPPLQYTLQLEAGGGTHVVSSPNVHRRPNYVAGVDLRGPRDDRPISFSEAAKERARSARAFLGKAPQGAAQAGAQALAAAEVALKVGAENPTAHVDRKCTAHRPRAFPLPRQRIGRKRTPIARRR
jgi:hypothetical protein